MQPHHADRGVGLVDGSIGRDTQIVFGAAFAAAERRGAVVPGPGIDAIECNHRKSLRPVTGRADKGAGSIVLHVSDYQRPMAQTVTMVMMIATNCSRTRARISFCDQFGEPPRIMTKASAGELALSTEVIDLAIIVDLAAAQVRDAIDRRGHTLRVHDAIRTARADRLGRLGLSAAKIKTLKMLAREIASERLNLDVLAEEDADAAHHTLTSLHGIGP